MRRVLLVIDDYNEMIYLQTLLKKVGFDTVGIQSTQKIADQMVTFRPEIVVADFYGSKISSMDLGGKLKRVNGLPRVAVLLPPKIELSQDQLNKLAIDAVVERPFTHELILKMLAHLGQLDVNGLLAKYSKITRGSDEDVGGQTDRVNSKMSTINAEERTRRFHDHLSRLPHPEADVIAHERVRAETAEMRAMAKHEDLDDLEDERRDFVRLLFKKPS